MVRVHSGPLKSEYLGSQDAIAMDWAIYALMGNWGIYALIGGFILLIVVRAKSGG